MTGLGRVSPSMMEASRTLGCGFHGEHHAGHVAVNTVILYRGSIVGVRRRHEGVADEPAPSALQF